VACGARTGLEVVKEERGEGGESPDGGGGAGGEPPILCEDDLVATTPAHVRLPHGDAAVRTLEIVHPPSAPGLACVVSDVANEDGSWDVAHGCFEAWSAWPGSLGTAFLTPGSDGGIAATEGAVGYGIVVGSRSGASLSAAFEVPPNDNAVSWNQFAMPTTGHRAAFLARSPGGSHFAGLAAITDDAERLEVVRLGQTTEPLGEIACARGPIAADAVASVDVLVIATGNGLEFDRCGQAIDLEPPSRLQVLALAPGGGTELRYEALHDAPIVDVRATAGDAGAVWVAWESGGAVSLVSVAPSGPVAAPVLVAKGSRGAIALATRQGEPIVASVHKVAGEEPEISVMRVTAAGDVELLGRFDTAGARWLRDLDLLVDPKTGHVIVAYVGQIGSNERAFARRLECP
jgi:hypothetical protein